MNIKKITRAPYRGVVIADSWLDHFIRNNGDPGELFLGESRPLKSSVSARTAIVEIKLSDQFNGNNQVFAKEFHYKNFFHSFKPLFRKHRVQILWRNSWYLVQREVNVPTPTGYLFRQVGLSCRNAYFFSEALKGCKDLGTLARNLEELEKRLDQGGLIETLAMMVASLHDSRMLHGDLKWSNIMVHQKENKTWIIDLDAAKICRVNPGPTRFARDVARFVLNCQEVGIHESIIERFLDTYASYRKLTRASFDKPVTSVLKKLREKHQKKYRR